MTGTSGTMFDAALAETLAGRNLAAAAMTAAMRDVVAGRVEDAKAAAFLTALRIKGETGEEIAAAAGVLHERMRRLVRVRGPVLDTCGTGGDGAGTFNISTAAALVAAAAGVAVVKHGGRAVSSRSGSADVLAALGVPIERGPEWSQACLDRHGFAFCFAPHFHEAMKAVAPLRQRLGFRTIFNLLGPLANPAQAEFQLLGVGDEKLIDPLAQAVARLGLRRAVLVRGAEGLDEVSLAGPTQVRIVENDEYCSQIWSPMDFGLPQVTTAEFQATTAAESAAIIRSVLANCDGPAKRIVLANAAAALWTAGAVATLKDGVIRAAEAIATGAASRLLTTLTA
jgi:anthranilate phosphoribosyltransferase